VVGAIEVTMIWADVDVVEVRIRASNDRFAATAEFYETRDGLLEAARLIDGFPTTVADRRVMELGDLRAQPSFGSARLSFYCVDSSGHCGALGEFRWCLRSNRPSRDESATFFIPLEAAAVDRFVLQLREVVAESERWK
jgi:hypothetical protein